jgi:DNA-binding transcriptional LysR family regulator
MDRLRSIEAFVRVADARSFAEAARRLGVSKSVVTTRVQQLEKFVRAPLFHRTTRAVRLSDIGAAFYRECAEVVDHTERLVGEMREAKGAPTGTLRVQALPGFATGAFGRQLCEFQERYPGIVLDLVVSDAIVDPVRDGFDVALQIFEPASDTLIAKRLYAWRPVFCATPAYLEAHGTPRKPKDLLHHRLGLYSRYPSGDRWTFRRGAHKTTVTLAPSLATNSVHLLRDYALAHAGIVCLPTLVAAEALATGTLRGVLLDHALPAFWLSAVYPATQGVMRKLQLFLDHLAAVPLDEPPWERDLAARGLLPVTA